MRQHPDPNRPASVAAPSEDQIARTLHAMRSRITPPVGAAMLYNLVYAVGFTRIVGSVEGAEAVDRGGTGKIHRLGDRRADDTTTAFLDWMTHGAHSATATASVAQVARIHEHIGRSYPMSNETFVHGLALFTLLFDELFRIVGADVFTAPEKAAQVAHWQAIGRQLGLRDIPDSWDGMRTTLLAYEADPRWFRPTAAGKRCVESLIRQFNNRWLPRPLHPLGAAVLLSLQPDHVLAAVGMRKPPAAVVRLIRWAFRLMVTTRTRLVPLPGRSA